MVTFAKANAIGLWMRIERLILSAMILISSSAVTGQTGNCVQNDAARPDCPDAILFFQHVQTALRNNDRKTLASLISYPVLTSLNHKKVRIRSSRELLSHFDEIFDGGERCAILNATDADVWGNWQGFMIGRGAIWFDAVGPKIEETEERQFRIITINNGSKRLCKSVALAFRSVMNTAGQRKTQGPSDSFAFGERTFGMTAL